MSGEARCYICSNQFTDAEWNVAHFCNLGVYHKQCCPKCSENNKETNMSNEPSVAGVSAKIEMCDCSSDCGLVNITITTDTGDFFLKYGPEGSGPNAGDLMVLPSNSKITHSNEGGGFAIFRKNANNEPDPIDRLLTLLGRVLEE